MWFWYFYWEMLLATQNKILNFSPTPDLHVPDFWSNMDLDSELSLNLQMYV